MQFYDQTSSKFLDGCLYLDQAITAVCPWPGFPNLGLEFCLHIHLEQNLK